MKNAHGNPEEAVQKYGLAADAFITFPVGGSYDGKPQTNLAKTN